MYMYDGRSALAFAKNASVLTGRRSSESGRFDGRLLDRAQLRVRACGKHRAGH